MNDNIYPQKGKIIFIAGTGRNGSTILGNVLGQIDNCISVGEIRYIWSDILNEHLCGCGVRVSRCEFWNKVLYQAFGNLSEKELRILCSITEEIAQNYQTPTPFLKRQAREQLSLENLRKTIDAFRRLYNAIRIVSGCDVIIDSSKKPEIHEFLLDHLFSDIYTLHLVRDPRATVYSWTTSKKNPDPHHPALPIYNRYKAALSWLWANFMISKIKGNNYFFLRYEDWVNAPEETIRRVIKFADISKPEKPILQGVKIQMKTHHTISGNPVRFQSGLMEITPDFRWKNAMSKSQQAIVLGLTWPLFVKYYL